MRLNFDAIVGNSEVLVRNNSAKFLKVVRTDSPEYERILKRKMHTNDEDKYASFDRTRKI